MTPQDYTTNSNKLSDAISQSENSALEAANPIDLAQVIDLSPTAFIVLDPKGYIQIWNRSATAITGYDAPEVVGRCIYDVFPTLEQLKPTIGPYLLEHSVIEREAVYVQHKQGRTILIGYSVALLRGANGKITGITVSCSDVTQRYRSLEILRSLEEAGKMALTIHSDQAIYQALAQKLQEVGLWSFSMMLDKEKQTLSPKFVLGLPRINTISESASLVDLKSYLPIEAIPVSKTKVFRHVLEKGESLFIPNLLDKLPSWISATQSNLIKNFLDDTDGYQAIVTPLRRGDSIIGGLLVGGNLSDADIPAITAFANHLSLALTNAALWQSLEERVEQRTMLLSTQREQLQAILNNINDAVILTDAQEKIEFVNPAWEQINGYTLEEVLGRRPSLIGNQRTPRAIINQLQRHLRQGVPWTGELFNRRKDGSEYEASLYIAPVRDDEREIRYYIGVNRDITEEKAIERTKEKFVQDMSHELRTPLTNIIFYLSLLEKRMPDLGTKYMETLKRETNRLHCLMENLLLLLRLDQGYVSLRFEVGDLRQKLSDILDNQTEQSYSHRIELQCTLPDEPVLVDVDDSLLNQALSNLAINAFSYAASQVWVSVQRKKMEDNEWVGVCMEDDGPGISEEEQKQIYTRFFRGESSQVQQFSGAGLGLSICQEIAELLGGWVECISQKEKGSTFIFWLPSVTETN